MTDEASVILQDVSKQYGNKPAVLRQLNLTVNKGVFLALLGPSGCGKTTTLKLINALLQPSAGEVFVLGQSTRDKSLHTQLRRQVGYVFQGYGLFPHLTVAENIGISPKLAGWPKEEIRARTEELLALVEMPMAKFGRVLPNSLSGGQQQRIGIARALACRPGIMLLDEAFSALDPMTRENLQMHYQHIHQHMQLTTIMVTHDVTEALLMADQIALFHRGSILQIGTGRELLNHPVSEDVTHFFESTLERVRRIQRLVELLKP